MKTIAFIDAAQFRPTVIQNRLNTKQKFDWSMFRDWLEKLANPEKGQYGLFDVHYFDCASDSTSKESFHTFLRTLGFQLHFTQLHEKQKRCPKCENQYLEYEQKGVDVGIAVTMVRLGYCNAYDQAILCSGDGDFAELVSFLRSGLGKRTVVVGWKNGISPQLRENAYSTVLMQENYNEFLQKENN